MTFKVGGIYMVRKSVLYTLKFVPKFLIDKLPDDLPLIFLYDECTKKNVYNYFTFGFDRTKIVKLSLKTCSKLKLQYVPGS